ncbi:transporter substrate-binding domain-containing protein [Pseudomonas sp.]|uniref:substrate-binding periplasmic protein n=1 Tax=Pseudomonas sp. TaxID=306 RepID=UPI00257E51BB|nr:transporter substrate-binding domain-containing protein [Pseudomonas sp.]
MTRSAVRLGWALGLLLSSAAYADEAPEKLVIAGDVWCPINCPEDAEQPGLFVELAQQIFAESGIQVEYRVINWARAVHDTRRGKLNALIGAGVEDAPGFVFTATAPGISQMCFFSRPDNAWRYGGVESLASISFGAINSYSYGAELDSYIHRHQQDSRRVQLASGDNALAINVDKVRMGRIDATIENSWVMAYYLSHRAADEQLQQVGCRTNSLPIYLAFSPALESSKRYRDIFEAGLQRFQRDGRMTRLLSRYGLQPLSTHLPR